MAYEQKVGFGNLFPNRKLKDAQPDHRGGACCPLCEAQLEIAAWEKQGQKGPFLSLKLSKPREPEGTPF